MPRAARRAMPKRTAASAAIRPLVPSSFHMFGLRHPALSSLGELAFGLAFWGGFVWFVLAYLGVA